MRPDLPGRRENPAMVRSPPIARIRHHGHPQCRQTPGRFGQLPRRCTRSSARASHWRCCCSRSSPRCIRRSERSPQGGTGGRPPPVRLPAARVFVGLCCTMAVPRSSSTRTRACSPGVRIPRQGSPAPRRGRARDVRCAWPSPQGRGYGAVWSPPAYSTRSTCLRSDHVLQLASGRPWRRQAPGSPPCSTPWRSGASGLPVEKVGHDPTDGGRFVRVRGRPAVDHQVSVGMATGPLALETAALTPCLDAPREAAPRPPSP
jgi:hypothetical protein